MKIDECPFCGGEAETKMYLWGRHSETKEPIWCYYVFCNGCDAMTDNIFKTRQEAIAAWNRRADHIRDTTKKVSNADLMRAMSDEELAKWMALLKGDTVGGSAKFILEWLQQPAKEEHNETD